MNLDIFLAETMNKLDEWLATMEEIVCPGPLAYAVEKIGLASTSVWDATNRLEEEWDTKEQHLWDDVFEALETLQMQLDGLVDIEDAIFEHARRWLESLNRDSIPDRGDVFSVNDWRDVIDGSRQTARDFRDDVVEFINSCSA